ncbi:hypothetical protein ACHAWF_016639, partial [Thalassiosira exigua]
MEADADRLLAAGIDALREGVEAHRPAGEGATTGAPNAEYERLFDRLQELVHSFVFARHRARRAAERDQYSDELDEEEEFALAWKDCELAEAKYGGMDRQLVGIVKEIKRKEEEGRRLKSGKKDPAAEDDASEGVVVGKGDGADETLVGLDVGKRGARERGGGEGGGAAGEGGSLGSPLAAKSGGLLGVRQSEKSLLAVEVLPGSRTEEAVADVRRGRPEEPGCASIAAGPKTEHNEARRRHVSPNMSQGNKFKAARRLGSCGFAAYLLLASGAIMGIHGLRPQRDKDAEISATNAPMEEQSSEVPYNTRELTQWNIEDKDHDIVGMMGDGRSGKAVHMDRTGMTVDSSEFGDDIRKVFVEDANDKAGLRAGSQRATLEKSVIYPRNEAAGNIFDEMKMGLKGSEKTEIQAPSIPVRSSKVPTKESKRSKNSQKSNQSKKNPTKSPTFGAPKTPTPGPTRINGPRTSLANYNYTDTPFEGHCRDENGKAYNLVRTDLSKEQQTSDSISSRDCAVFCHSLDSIEHHPGMSFSPSGVCSCWYDSGSLPMELDANVTVEYMDDSGSGPVAMGSNATSFDCYPVQNYTAHQRASLPNVYIIVDRYDAGDGGRFKFNQTLWQIAFGLADGEWVDREEVNQWRNERMIWTGIVTVESDTATGVVEGDDTEIEDGDWFEPLPPDDVNMTGFCDGVDCTLYRESDCFADGDGSGRETSMNSTTLRHNPQARCTCCANQELKLCNVTDGEFLDAVNSLLDSYEESVLKTSYIVEYLLEEFDNCTEEFFEDRIDNSTELSNKIHAMLQNAEQQYGESFTERAVTSVSTTIEDYSDDPLHYQPPAEVQDFDSVEEIEVQFNPLSRIVGHHHYRRSSSANDSVIDHEIETDVTLACGDIGMTSQHVDHLIRHFGTDEHQAKMNSTAIRQFIHRKEMLNVVRSRFIGGEGQNRRYVNRHTSLTKGLSSRRRRAMEQNFSFPSLPSSSIQQLQSHVTALRKALPMHSDFLLRRLEVVAAEEQCHGDTLDCAATEIERLYGNIRSNLANAMDVITVVLKVVRPIVNSVTKAIKKTTKIVKKAEDTYSPVLEDGLHTITSVFSVMGTVSRVARVAADVGGSTCVRNLFHETLGVDVIDNIERGLDGLIDFARKFGDALKTLILNLASDAWTEIRDTINKTIEAFENITDKLRPLRPLEDLLTAEVVIPWIEWPYLIERKGDSKCQPNGENGVGYESEKGILHQNTCYEKTPPGWQVRIVNPWEFKRTCEDPALPGNSFFGDCYNDNYRRPNKYWPPTKEWGWCGSWIRYPCITRTCSSTFGDAWFRNFMHCVQNCPSSRTQSLGYCYSRTCPVDYTASSQGKYCSGNTRAIRSHDAVCDVTHDDDGTPVVATVGWEGFGCYTNDIIEFIDGLPIFHTILNGIDSIVKFTMTELGLLEPINKLLNFTGVLPNFTDFNVSKIITEPLEKFKEQLPEGPDLGAIADLPSKVLDLLTTKVPELPESVSNMIKTCRDSNFDATSCISEAFPEVGNLLGSLDGVSGMVDNLKSNLTDGISSILAGIQCTNMTNMTIPVSDIIKDNLGIDLGNEVCDVQLPMCQSIDFVVSQATFENVLNNTMSPLREQLERMLNAVRVLLPPSSSRSLSDDTHPDMWPLVIIPINWWTEPASIHTFLAGNRVFVITYEPIIKVEFGVRTDREWNDVNKYALQVSQEFSFGLEFYDHEWQTETLILIVRPWLKLARFDGGEYGTDSNSIWNIGKACWSLDDFGQFDDLEKRDDYLGSYPKPSYHPPKSGHAKSTPANDKFDTLEAACVETMNQAREILLSTDAPKMCSMGELVPLISPSPLTARNIDVHLRKCRDFWSSNERGNLGAIPRAELHINKFRSFSDKRHEYADYLHHDIVGRGNRLGWIPDDDRSTSLFRVGSACYDAGSINDDLQPQTWAPTDEVEYPKRSVLTGQEKDKCEKYIWKAENTLFNPTNIEPFSHELDGDHTPRRSCAPRFMQTTLDDEDGIRIYNDEMWIVSQHCRAIWTSWVFNEVEQLIQTFLRSQPWEPVDDGSISAIVEAKEAMPFQDDGDDSASGFFRPSDFFRFIGRGVSALNARSTLDLPTGNWLNRHIPGFTNQYCRHPDLVGEVGTGHMVSIVTPLGLGDSGLALTFDFADQTTLLSALYGHNLASDGWELPCWAHWQWNDFNLGWLRQKATRENSAHWPPLPSGYKTTLEIKAHLRILPHDESTFPFKLEKVTPQPSSQPSGQPSSHPTSSQQPSHSKQPSQEPTTTESPTLMPSQEPTDLPTSRCPYETFQTFQTRQELDAAIAGFIDGDRAAVTDRYGPIERWCFGPEITDFSELFNDFRRLFLDRGTFNEDINLSQWDVSSVMIMRSMFFGASRFRGVGLDRWNLFSVRDVQFMFASATSFNQNLFAWSNQFPYSLAGGIFTGSGCPCQETPRPRTLLRPLSLGSPRREMQRSDVARGWGGRAGDSVGQRRGTASIVGSAARGGKAAERQFSVVKGTINPPVVSKCMQPVSKFMPPRDPLDDRFRTNPAPRLDGEGVEEEGAGAPSSRT